MRSLKVEREIEDLLNRYTYRAEWSEEDDAYVAYCLELPSVRAHGDTAEGSITEVKTPIAVALESLAESGEDLPEPLSTHKYKGNLTLRTTPEKHRELAMRAAEAGVSVNQYILSKI